ncbi:MAG: DUF4293 family protein [Saprospiraceae bacterium]
MIQRLQTVFLFLAFLAFLAIFQFPFAVSDVQSAGFLSDMDYDVFDSAFLLALTALGGLTALIAIFLFKNRTIQLKLSYLIIVFSVLILVVAAVLFYNEAKNLIHNKGEIDDSIALYMPFLSMVFGVLAARFIGKDEKTVRSMDRLR